MKSTKRNSINMGFRAFLSILFVFSLVLSACTDKNQSLIKAAKNGNAAEVKTLLARSADLNARLNGYTALMWVATMSHPEVVKILIAHGADVNAKDQDGFTALMEAADRGNVEIVKTLIANGADVNAEAQVHTPGNPWYSIPFTAMSIAKGHGYSEIVRMLKQAGATSYNTNNNGIFDSDKEYEQNKQYRNYIEKNAKIAKKNFKHFMRSGHGYIAWSVKDE